ALAGRCRRTPGTSSASRRRSSRSSNAPTSGSTVHTCSRRACSPCSIGASQRRLDQARRVGGMGTIEEADNNLGEVRERADDKTAKRVSERVKEAVLDKGYHSNGVLVGLEESEIRSYVSEPDRGNRRWK